MSLSFGGIFCGRDHEILELDRLYRRTACSPQVVLIRGNSGSGKSALVKEYQKHLSLTEESFWISGKFQEQRQTDPFAAIIDAFGQFCHKLDRDEPETFEEVQYDVREAVGNQSSLLTFTIPSLAKLLDDDADYTPCSVGLSENQSNLRRFHLAFANVLQALASQVRSVIFCLDDLQWADPASLELLVSVFTSRLKHVMLLGTYRSNEVDHGHRLSKWADSIESKSQSPQSILKTLDLSDMPFETVNTLVASVLHLELDTTRSLTHIIFMKTNGNMFFVVQYMLFLTKKNLLFLDNKTDSWTWNENGVRNESAVTTTLLDFMRNKISQSTVAAQILPIAACIGSKFSVHSLIFVLGRIREVHDLQESLLQSEDVSLTSELQALLVLCEKEDFIEYSGNQSYRFVHDKVQEAALTIHTEETMKRLRYETGVALLQQLDENELDKNIFLVANLINSPHENNDALRPLEMAQLNWKAAKKAKALGAFSSAAGYIEIGRIYLPRGKHRQNRLLVLDLYSLGAEVEESLGHTEKVEFYCNMILKSTDFTVLEQIRIQEVMIDNIANTGGRTDTALKRCLRVLEQLGCRFPKSTVRRVTCSVSSLFKCRATKNILSTEDADHMVMMTDKAKVESMKLLDQATTYAWMTTNQLIFTMCATRMVRWTIRYGICEKSPPAFAIMGIIMLHVLGDSRKGELYGDLAISLMRNLEAIASTDETQGAQLGHSQSRTMYVAYGMLLCWIKPIEDYQVELVRAYECGMRYGDTESAFWSKYFVICNDFSCGTPLASVEENCRSSVSQMVTLQREEAEVVTRFVWQSCLNLIDSSPVEGTVELTGSAMREKDYFEKSKLLQSKVPSKVYGHIKTMLCAFFEDFEQGAELAMERGDSFNSECPGAALGQQDPFFRGLCLYAAASKTNNLVYRRHAHRTRSVLRSWVEKGNPNVVHHLKLLDAEAAACIGKRELAKTLYDKACAEAHKRGFIQDTALASERFAQFLLLPSAKPSKEDTEHGTNRLLEAVRLYKAWGAGAKVKMLLERNVLDQSGVSDGNTML